MFTSKLKVVLGITILLSVIITTLVLTSPLIASRTQSQGKTDSFAYSIQGGKGQSQSVYIAISVDWDDPEARQKYSDKNIQRGHELVNNGQKELIPIQVTFAHPISVDEARQLVESTGFIVDSFLLVGNSTISQQRGTHIQFSDLDNDVPHRELIDPATGEEIVFVGVMVLRGHVFSDAYGLGQWLANDVVYFVDTSEVELRELLNKHHLSEIAGKEIDISVPSPFWDLDW
jgi:hypothetical protein